MMDVVARLLDCGAKVVGALDGVAEGVESD